MSADSQSDLGLDAEPNKAEQLGAAGLKHVDRRASVFEIDEVPRACLPRGRVAAEEAQRIESGDAR